MNNQAWRHVLPLIGYLAIICCLSWPALLAVRTNVIGEGGDPWQSLWRFEHTSQVLAQAVEENTLGQFLQEEFLGGGQPRLVNLSVWPWLWLHELVGEPLAYNSIWFLSFVAAGYTMYLLMWWLLSTTTHPIPLTSKYLAAWLAGLFYMLLPFHVAHAKGHFGAMQIQWLPLLILVFLVWLKRPTISRSFLLAVVATIQAWTEHHYLLWFVLFALLYLLLERQGVLKKLRHRWPSVLATALLLLVGIILPYWPTIRASQSEIRSLQLGPEQTIRFSADVFAFIIPAPFHTLWGGATSRLFSTDFTGNVAEATHYVGLVPLLLIAFFHQRIPAAYKKVWLTVAAIFFLVSLGPRLHLLGRITPVPLPYAIIDSWPVFDAIRTVSRASILVGVSVAVLLGLVVATQFKRYSTLTLVAGLIVIEFLFAPVAVQSTQLSPAYAAIKETPGTSLIELPAATNYAAASRSLYASATHGKTVLGNLALERGQDPAESQASLSLPGVRQLLFIKTAALEKNRAEFFGQDLAETIIEVMRAQAATTILLHTDSLSPQQNRIVRDFIQERLKLPATEFTDATIYTLTDTAGLSTDGIYVVRGDGWDSYTFDVDRQDVTAQVQHRAAAHFINTRSTPMTIEVSFTIPASSPTTFTFEPGPRPLTLIDGQVGKRVTQTFTLTPGETKISLINHLTDPIVLKDPAFKVVE